MISLIQHQYNVNCLLRWSNTSTIIYSCTFFYTRMHQPPHPTSFTTNHHQIYAIYLDHPINIISTTHGILRILHQIILNSSQIPRQTHHDSSRVYLSNPNMKFTPIFHHPEPIDFKSFLQHAHHPTAIYQLLPTSTNQGQHTTQMTTIAMAIHPSTHQPNTHILFIDLHTLGLQSFNRVLAIDYPIATRCLIHHGHHLYASTLSPVSYLQWNP